MTCFEGSSLQDENPSDITVDEIVNKLLYYFRGLQRLEKTKAKIEMKCGIQKKSIWSVNDIKRAWTQKENMKKKKIKKNQWSFVIVLQELERRVHNDEKSERKEAEPDLKENEDMQACGTAETNENTDSRSLKSDTELKMGGDASQAAECYQNTSIIEEPTEDNISQENWHIRIPLLEMSEKKIPTDYPCSNRKRKTTNTKFKLKNGCPSDKEVMIRKSYAMSYNYDTKNADWVYEILNKSTLTNNCSVPGWENKNYERGHLASAANHRWCVEAENDASLFSNITPQTEELNRGAWKKLENYCRKIVEEEKVRNVHVYTGPLYSNTKKEVVGRKAVPSDFFKVIIVEEEDGTVKEPECYCIPNSTLSRPRKKTTVEDIEGKSGLIFVEKSNSTIRESIMKITLEGKDLFEEPCTAEIEVRISL